MNETLEERVKLLEEKLSAVSAKQGPKARKKDWRRTFGMSASDPRFKEMIRLGREYRKATWEPS